MRTEDRCPVCETANPVEWPGTETLECLACTATWDRAEAATIRERAWARAERRLEGRVS